MIKEKIENFIEENSDEKKAKFDNKLISTKYEIKGIATKSLENFAKTLAKEGVDVYDMPLDNYEEILLAGMVLAFSKLDGKEKVKGIEYLLPYIDNWGSCDLIVGRLKKLEDQKEFFINLLDENKTYYNRVGIVWLMRFALKNDLQNIVKLLNERVKSQEYYVEMALSCQ